ncbi:MAG: serine hydroxymethyltransferase [Kiloniellaceae bacterium]
MDVPQSNGSPATAWAELFAAPLFTTDRQMGALLAEEGRRNGSTVNLIASESYCPRATVEVEASILVTKNASGYPGAREVAGCEVFDKIERLAQRRAERLFGADHANVQAIASTVANIAVLRALLDPGDRILSLQGSAGGHHSHGAAYHLTGQDYAVTGFGVDEAAQGIDLEAVRRLAEEVRPRIIIAGSTAYPRAIDFRGLQRVAESVGALFFADIAHVAGLVAAGIHENPTLYSDVVTTSTHKTFCGPRTGGLVLCKTRHAAAIDAAVYPGLQGAPGAHIIASRAVLFDLAAREPFRRLMLAVVTNAQALSGALQEANLPLYLGGTDTHMVVIDLRQKPWDPLRVERRLERHGLLVNRVGLPPRKADKSGLGLRLGTTAMTIRGMSAREFAELGPIIAGLLEDGDGDRMESAAFGEIAALARRYPLPDAALVPHTANVEESLHA